MNTESHAANNIKINMQKLAFALLFVNCTAFFVIICWNPIWNSRNISWCIRQYVIIVPMLINNFWNTFFHFLFMSTSEITAELKNKLKFFQRFPSFFLHMEQFSLMFLSIFYQQISSHAEIMLKNCPICILLYLLKQTLRENAIKILLLPR